ncbi:leucine-rich repeat domain-containing protein [Flavivirga amylovorans]|uniref:Leucine-rich repeat domain-containing protein n=1 Tax=Flavivirga amylovorans TaxID=870486 RepID=A0ABT8X1N8_9FLAO|nr:leucine-rich repeat domain-containing protein [Flavivirga amylovorans]MDO5987490.1 leucine-rich repeat domain-containing protein [Flavivirga amylovorans]
MKRQLKLKKWSFTFFSMLLLSIATYGQQNFTHNNIQYEVVSGTTEVKVIGYDGTAREVDIPEIVNNYTVVAIGAKAFFNPTTASSSERLKEITIPPTVTSIGREAFANNELTSIDLSNVTTIGKQAFENNLLISVTMSEDLVTIEDSIFKNNKLRSIEIPNSVETIGNSAFGTNELINSVTIPENVKTIKEWAFANNPSGPSHHGQGVPLPVKRGIVTVFMKPIEPPGTPITKPEIHTVGSDIFTTTRAQYVVAGTNDPLPPLPRNGVIDLIVPEGKASVYRNWYVGNYFKTIREESFTVNDITYKITKITPGGGEVMVMGYQGQGQLTNVNIPETVSNIVFEYNYIDINNDDVNDVTEYKVTGYEYKVTSIGPGTFSGKQLSSIDIPENVTSIGESAFSNNQLTSVTIPNRVSSIGNNAFKDNALDIVVVEGDIKSTRAPSISMDDSENPFGDAAARSQIDLIISVDNRDKFVDGWTGFNNVIDTFTDDKNIEYEITSLNNNPYYEVRVSGYDDSATNTDIEIPEDRTVGNLIEFKVTAIGPAAFQKPEDPNAPVVRLTSVDIPDSVTSIGSAAFQFNALTNVVIPNSVTAIGAAAFEGNGLTSVTISKNITKGHMGTNVFSKNNFEQVTIPEKMEFIPNSTFSKNSNSKFIKVVIPDNVTVIGNRAFAETKLKEVILPKELDTIGAWAFSIAPALVKVEIKAESPPSHIIDLTTLGSLIPGRHINQQVFTTGSVSLTDNSLNFLDRRHEIDLIVPESAEQAYRDDDFWGGFKSINGDVTMSLNNTNELRDFTVYPNPAQDKIHIRLSDGQALEQVNIYNMLGAHLYTTHTSPLDVSHLSGGMYILEVTTKTGAKAVKKISIK